MASILTALSSTVFRLAAHQVSLSQPLSYLVNKFILIGLAISLFTFVLNITAYRYGDLSVLQPLFRVTIIWKLLIARFYFGEVITRKTVFSIGLILGSALLLTTDL